MKPLILYYSYGGNTQQIAQRIQQRLGGDLARIQPVVPYPEDYNAVVDQGKREVRDGTTPELQPLEVDPGDYDVVFLGTPVWWYTFAPAVKTFLVQNHLAGKTVHPFVTDGGWIGHTVEDLAKACSGAKLGRAIDIRFNGADLSTPVSEIDRWMDEAVRS